MFGLIARLRATDGDREELEQILLKALHDLPGCLSYVIARDLEDANAIWVTEVWEDEDSHEDSLKLPAVQQAIARAKPMIAGFDQRVITRPVGGHGIDATV